MDFSRFTDPQAESVRTLDRPLLICAGAGSGKTFTLTQRLTWALMPGSAGPRKAFLDDVTHALVITFTDKAASEIKERVRASLRAEGLFDQALKVDAAWVSTIHGACLRILKAHALELGLDPDLAVADTASAQQAVDDAVRETVTAAERGQGAASNDLAMLLAAYDADKLQERLSDVMDKAATLPDGLDSFSTGPAPLSPRALAERLANAIDGVEGHWTGKNAAKAESLSHMLHSFASGSDEAGFADLRDLLDEGPSLTRPRNDEEAAAVVEQWKRVRSEVWLAQGQTLAKALLSLARQVDERYHRSLAAQGVMDMADIVRTTLAAFRNHPDIARSYRDRFHLVMVDEFQDTSQLQVDMVAQLCAPDRSNLCTVGDAQQSIYRFQGADVGVYMDHKERMSELAGRGPVQLSANYRSHADVLSFVRRVCGAKGYFPEDFLDLTAQRDEGRVAKGPKAYKGVAPRVELAVFEAGKGADAVQAEADHIAQRFAELHRQGHPFSQMVVLMGTTTHLEVYAQALRDAGLPCRAEGGSGFYDRPEVALCQSLMAAIANPLDSQDLLSVLTSDALPVSSDDLLLLATRKDESTGRLVRQDIGLGVMGEAPEGASDLLKHAMEVLHRAWRRVGTDRPSDVLIGVVVESGWMARMQEDGAEGMARAANVLKFVSVVRDAEAAEGFDVVRTANQVLATANAAHEKQGSLSVTGDDAVRLMTVHSSKGLEFPIVAVTNCYTINTQRTSKPSGTGKNATTSMGRKAWITLAPPHTPSAGVYKPDADFALHMEDVSPDQAQSLVEFRYAVMDQDYSAELSEKRRLFYVAATRASEALIVSIAHKRSKNTRFKEVERDIVDAFWPEEQLPPTGEVRYHDDVDGRDHTMAFTYVDVDAEEEEEDPKGPDRCEGQAPSEGGEDAKGVPSSVSTRRQTQSPDDGDDASVSLIGSDAVTVTVPILNERRGPTRVPTARPTGVYSFSSLAAQQEGARAALADVEMQNGADATPGTTGETAGEGTEKSMASFLAEGQGLSEAHLVETVEQAEGEALTSFQSPHLDDPTSFGDALHRCCEWAAYHVGPDDKPPSHDELSSVAKRQAKLNGVDDVPRLMRALDAWTGSKVCKKAFSFDAHCPETRFSCKAGNAVLEGSIDLLCHGLDGQGAADLSHALVVDYKTGGSPEETKDELAGKHSLQAKCYALAVLDAGFARVDAVFVRLEQLAADGQPQTVRYSFDQGQRDALESEIASLM